MRAFQRSNRSMYVDILSRSLVDSRRSPVGPRKGLRRAEMRDRSMDIGDCRGLEGAEVGRSETGLKEGLRRVHRLSSVSDSKEVGRRAGGRGDQGFENVGLVTREMERVAPRSQYVHEKELSFTDAGCRARAMRRTALPQILYQLHFLPRTFTGPGSSRKRAQIGVVHQNSVGSKHIWCIFGVYSRGLEAPCQSSRSNLTTK